MDNVSENIPSMELTKERVFNIIDQFQEISMAEIENRLASNYKDYAGLPLGEITRAAVYSLLRDEHIAFRKNLDLYILRK